jgi:hypothetical protein
MPTPAVSTNFADLLDPRFQQIFHDEYDNLPDMVGEVCDIVPTNGRNDMRWGQVGAFGDVPEFTGTVEYDSMSEGYDTIMTPIEYASGFQVERKLFDDDQYSIMDQRPAGLAEAWNRTRQQIAFRIFNNAFSVDTKFYNNTEAVALCSNSHTTRASGVSTASGFDNLGTSSLTATAVTAARIAFMNFRDDRANRRQFVPDELWYPNDLYGEATEILQSAGKPDTGNNNINIHQGGYMPKSSVWMTDTNNWFLTSSRQRKKMVKWQDRVPAEFAMVEDFDTLVAKWRLYARLGMAHIDWRWIFGSQVS